jgi:outer membrane receptor protein involved in Fe transport
VAKGNLLRGVALCGLWCATAWAQVSPGAPASPSTVGQDGAAAGQSRTDEITVIGATPLLGSGVDRDKIPASTVVLRSGDLQRTGAADATRALNENAGSVDLDQAVGNEFQPNLLFRGFEASPLAGDAQGLAVYVDGSRFNSSFADTTNWDLIPSIAIRELDVVGSNPAFGLNSLGGGVSVKMKDGWSDPGGEVEASGGSFGRAQLSGQYGAKLGDFAAYVAATGVNDGGWREDSPSQVRQLYTDLDWRTDGREVRASFTYANNNLLGNGTTPVELLDADRAAVFTYPDETRNRYVRATLNGDFRLTDTLSLQANAYGSYLDQLTYNGDAGDEQVCHDPTYVCEGDGETVLTDRDGRPIRNVIFGSPYLTKFGFAGFAEGGPYSVLNVTSTVSDSYGASAQITSTRDILGHHNHLVIGAGYDGGTSDFSAETYLGGFTVDRDYIPFPNVEIDQADRSISPVAVHTTNDYAGVFATDTFDVTDTLFATISGRFNHARIDLRDRNGAALDGDHGFDRFNPAAGLSTKLTPNLTAYAGYAESNRAPTPSELSCASPDAPCSLTNFFVGDPDLRQVVSHTCEAGLDAHYRLGGGRLTGHAGYFRTDNDDDIQFVTSATIGRAYFRNVGETRREGAEGSINYKTDRYLAYASYTYTAATFRTPLVLSNDSNPNADADGNYAVRPGDALPGIPAHAVKVGTQAHATASWTVGIEANAASGEYLFGDEGNQSRKTSSYVVFNFNTAYQVTRRLQLFASIENMFGARYETYGTFAPTADVPIAQAPGAANPRAFTPGAPVGGFGGVRYTF